MKMAKRYALRIRRKSMNADFEKMFGALYGGAAIAKGTDLVAHARQPVALIGDVQGLAGVGIAGAFGSVAMKVATGGLGPLRKKRKRG